MSRNEKKPKILKIHWGFSLTIEKKAPFSIFLSLKKMIFIWRFSVDFEKAYNSLRILIKK